MNLPDASQTGDLYYVAYGENPPWDVGKPQPDLIALLGEIPPTGPVLDAGCGTGDLALALAGRGLEVLAVDIAPVAIAQARAKAEAGGPETRRLVEFRTGDALHPSQLPGPFGAVVDSGFFHLFGPPEREAFALELAVTLAPGGRYYLLGLTLSSPMPNAPRAVRQEELRSLFAPEFGWRIRVLRPARFVIRPAPDGVPAVAACIEREP